MKLVPFGASVGIGVLLWNRVLYQIRRLHGLKSETVRFLLTSSFDKKGLERCWVSKYMYPEEVSTMSKVSHPYLVPFPRYHHPPYWKIASISHTILKYWCLLSLGWIPQSSLKISFVCIIFLPESPCKSKV